MYNQSNEQYMNDDYNKLNSEASYSELVEHSDYVLTQSSAEDQNGKYQLVKKPDSDPREEVVDVWGFIDELNQSKDQARVLIQHVSGCYSIYNLNLDFLNKEVVTELNDEVTDDTTSVDNNSADTTNEPSDTPAESTDENP